MSARSTQQKTFTRIGVVNYSKEVEKEPVRLHPPGTLVTLRDGSTDVVAKHELTLHVLEKRKGNLFTFEDLTPRT